MKKRDFLDSNDFAEQQVLDMMNLGVALKSCVRVGYHPPLLRKKQVAMLLPYEGTTQRIMLETATEQLGGHLIACNLPLEPGNALRETALTLSRCFDLAVVKNRHEVIEALAKYAEIPIVNAGSDFCSPVQEISDLITMFEHLPPEKKLEECKVVYYGRASAMCSSILFACSKIGMQFVQLTGEAKEELTPPVLKLAEKNVKKSGGTYAVTQSSEEAFRNAHFLVMDAPLATKLPPDAEGILRVDPTENHITALRAVMTCMLYENPALREPMLIEKMKRMLTVKLQAIFGFGEVGEP